MIKRVCLAFFTVFLTFNTTSLSADMFHQNTIEENWIQDNVLPFDELMVTWNGKRPTYGRYSFYVSVKLDEWSPWLLYANWGSNGQSSFKNIAENAPVRVFQDALEVLEGKKATGFRIKIVPEGNCNLDYLYGLHVYTNNDNIKNPEPLSLVQESLHLKVVGLSQMKLNHSRHLDLCSPASTSAVVRYLLGNLDIDPVYFAQSSWDSGFDIFGNWVFNVAQASSELGPKWGCWVERLSGFDRIYERLKRGVPVVVSIRGPISGSALPYAKGHLLVVIGYDANEGRVICMDPAFSSDNQTEVSYDLSEFVQAWNRRGRVAYIFNQADISVL